MCRVSVQFDCMNQFQSVSVSSQSLKSQFSGLITILTQQFPSSTQDDSEPGGLSQKLPQSNLS